MDTLPRWQRHYRYMPYTEDDPLFEERIAELREDREFDRRCCRYGRGDDLLVDLWYTEVEQRNLKIEANEIRVHPDNDQMKNYKRPYGCININLVSEDVQMLGKDGAALIARIDDCQAAVMPPYARLRERCSTKFKVFKAMAMLTGVNYGPAHRQCKSLTGECYSFSRSSIEIYIMEHPDAPFEMYQRKIDKRLKLITSRVDQFSAEMDVAVAKIVDEVLHDKSVRMSILAKYREAEAEYEKAPVKNFIFGMRYLQPEVSRDGRIVSWWLYQDETLRHDAWDRLFMTAWMIDVCGFNSLRTNSWPHDIESIPDMIVLIYQMLTKYGRSSTLLKHNWKSYENLIAAVSGALRAKAQVDKAYSMYTMTEESGVESVYEEYINFFNNTITGAKIGDKCARDYIADSMYLITTRAQKLITTMENLNKEHRFSVRYQHNTGRAATLSASVSPLDYEEGIHNAIQLILCSEHCRDDSNGNRRVLFTRFSITDETKDNGIGLCLVLQKMARFVSSIEVVTKNMNLMSMSGSVHNKLYNMFRDKEYGEEFSINGLIFWNTDMSLEFNMALQRMMRS